MSARIEGAAGRAVVVRRTAFVAGALGLVAAVAALARPSGAAPAPAHGVAVVERGAVVSRVTASGTVSARRTVAVSSQVSGRVKELAADFNTRVRRGQLLARIDPQPFEAAVAQAEASAASARASREKARAKVADLERQVVRRRELAQRELVAVEELQTLEADLAMARADASAGDAAVAQAAAALAQARFNLASSAIRSPIDGLVVSRDLDEGQTVAASLQAPTLFTLAQDLHSMQVKAHVSEADVGRVAEGMAASFTVSAFPGEPFAGTVRQVRTAPQTTENVVTYDVIVDADNPGLRLRPGMTANVSFVVAERQGVLRVPNAALRFRPAGVPAAAGAAGGARDRRVLYRLEGEVLRPVPVTTGLTDGSVTELTAGVAEGDRVATAAGDGASTRRAAGGPPPGPPRMF